MEKKTLEKLFKLTHVPRWAIVDMLKEQSVAEHTFRTAAIYHFIADRLGLEIPWYKILSHDIDEAETGDIPSNFKNGGTFKISKQSLEHSLLQLADTVEARIWLNRYGVIKRKVDIYLINKITILKKEIREKYPQIGNIVDEVYNIGIGYD